MGIPKELMEYIKEDPDRWKFIADLLLVYATTLPKQISLRGIEASTGIPFKSASRRIDYLYYKLVDTPSDTPVDTHQKVITICELTIYRYIKSQCDTPVDTLVTHLKEERKKKDKENPTVSSQTLLFSPEEKKKEKKEENNSASNDACPTSQLNGEADDKSRFRIDYEAIAELWNSLVSFKLPSIKAKMSDSRKNQIRIRLNQCCNADYMDDLNKIFQYIAKDDFYGITWKNMNFDWLFKSNNFQKSLERAEFYFRTKGLQLSTNIEKVSPEAKEMASAKLQHMHPSCNTAENRLYLEEMLTRYPYTFGTGLPIVRSTEDYFVGKFGSREAFLRILDKIERDKPTFKDLTTLLNGMID